MADLTIRPAKIDEARELTELALRSKSHWGYSLEFMAACRSELMISKEMIKTLPILVAERDGRVVGFCTLSSRNAEPETELSLFFVDPSYIGSGVGKALWRELVQESKRLGIPSFKILSDPQAEEFYLKMGAKRIGVGRSSVRELPLLEFALSKDQVS